MVRIEHEKEREISTLLTDASWLSSAIEQHLDTFGVAVVPLFRFHFGAGRVEPGDIPHLKLLIKGAGQEAPAVEEGLALADLD